MRTSSCISFFICFFLASLFSFSQNKYPEFFIEHDSVINPQFRDISDKLVASLLKHDGSTPLLKPYTDNLRPATGADILGHFFERRVIQNTNAPPSGPDTAMIPLTVPVSYFLRQENGRNYISPSTRENSYLWLSLDELGGVLNDSEVIFLERLFIDRTTNVQFTRLICIDQDRGMENNFDFFWQDVKRGILNGTYTGYEDPYFRFEITPSQARSKTDTFIIGVAGDFGGDSVMIPVERIPSHCRYLYSGKEQNGKLKMTDEVPVALEFVEVKKKPGGDYNFAKYNDFFWVRTQHMVLSQWKKNMIKDWARGNTCNYFVDRYFTSLYQFTSDPGKENFRKAIDSLIDAVGRGNLTGYAGRSFMLELTPGQSMEIISRVDSSVNKFQTHEGFDRIGLCWYWYRRYDSIMDFIPNTIGISIGSSQFKNGTPQLYFYLPEVLHTRDSSLFRVITSALVEKLKPRTGKFKVKSWKPDAELNYNDQAGNDYYPLSEDTLVSGPLVLSPENFPDALGENDSVWIKYIPAKVFSDSLYHGPVQVYLSSISLDPFSPGTYSPAKMLIPYGDGGSDGALWRPCLLCKTGYCDENGVIRIPLKYDGAELFSEGRARVCHATFERNGWSVTVKYKYGFIDADGNEVIPCVYDDALSFSDGLAAVKQKGQWAYINKDGSLHYPFAFDKAFSFSEGRAVVEIGGKFGVIGTRSKKLICNVIYDSICEYHSGFARVRVKDKWGVMDLKGTLRLDTSCQYISEPANGSFLAKDAYNEFHVLNLKCKDMFHSHELDVQSVYGNVMVVKRDSSGWSKYALYDISGKQLCNFIYDRVKEFSEGKIAVCRKERWGYMNESGVEVIPCKYEQAFPFSDGVALVTYTVWEYFINGRPLQGSSIKKFIDSSGRELSGFSVDDVMLHYQYPEPIFNNKLMRIRTDWNDRGYLGRDGREYIYH